MVLGLAHFTFRHTSCSPQKPASPQARILSIMGRVYLLTTAVTSAQIDHRNKPISEPCKQDFSSVLDKTLAGKSVPEITYSLCRVER